MGSNARARVKALFSEKTMVDRYEKMLLEIQSIVAAQERQPLHNRSETGLR